MSKACYPGSFDPITNGHLDIIKKASKLFEAVDVVVAINQEKNGMFSYEDRLDMIKEATKDLKNVNVKYHDGLIVDYCKDNNIDSIIRGLRNTLDFENEFSLYQVNKELNPNIETVLLFTSLNNRHISSSSVKELLKFNKDISKYVPSSVLKYIK